MTRNGKIARLPRPLRDALNTRLDDGEPAKPLLLWLNSLDEVKTLLSADFGGRPISEQNLSEWKQGGFRDWQRRREAGERLSALVELSDEIHESSQDESIANRLALVLSAELAAETRQLLEDTADPRERWRYLCDALRHLCALRRGDHASARAAVERERWEIECEKRDQQADAKHIQKLRDQAIQPVRDAMHRPALVAALGGGEQAEKAVDYILEVNRICAGPDPTPPAPAHPSSPPSNQTESN